MIRQSRIYDPTIHPRRPSDDEHWKERGLCIEHDPKLWANDDPQAKAICDVCPVQEQCRDYIYDIIGRKVPGTWGGTTYADRNPLSTPPGVVRVAGGRFAKAG